MFAISTKVLAEDQYEEITYDDLIQQINRQKTVVSNSAPHRFDNLMIHAGFGLITSVNSVRISNSDTFKYQNGFQISLGIDLFSAQFSSEAVLRNFGQTHSGSETRSLREFDLKFLYRDLVDNQVGLRAGGGLGTRYFKLSDPAIGLDINDSTPAGIIFAGMDAYFNKNFSMGIELGFRSALVTRTADKNSMDLSFRMDSAF